MPRFAPVINTGAGWSAIEFLSAEVVSMTEFYVVRPRTWETFRCDVSTELSLMPSP
jgi:hypothetical protein